LALAIQSDGKLVVSGVTISNNVHDIAIARYDANGSLDNSLMETEKLQPISETGTTLVLELEYRGWKDRRCRIYS